MFKFVYETFINPAKRGAGWFYWAGGSIASLWLFFWWAIGALPTDAFGSGFARAEDLLDIKAVQLEELLLNRRIRYCEAPAGSDVKRFFFQSVSEKADEYFTVTGREYRMPPCSDLVITDTA